MQFDLLPDCKDALPLIANWYFDEWGYENPGATLEDVSERIRGKYLHNRQIPLIICGFEKGDLVGACQLKFHEMKRYPGFEHWLGGVYTSPDKRRRGIGRLLVKHAIGRASELGVRSLYLQTEDLSGGLYKKLGWEPIELVQKDCAEVLVMKRQLEK